MQRVLLATVAFAALVIAAHADTMRPELAMQVADNDDDQGDVDHVIRWGGDYGVRNLSDLGWSSEHDNGLHLGWDKSWRDDPPGDPSAPTTSVPGPLAGAGLPGLFAGALALLAFYRRRRQLR